MMGPDGRVVMRHRSQVWHLARGRAGNRARALESPGTDVAATAIMASKKRWSQHVTEHSHALDLEPAVFKKRTPKEIARSLKRSAERSTHRKSSPFHSAMSMLTFYINRAGRHLGAGRRQVLTQAKQELRVLFGREPHRS